MSFSITNNINCCKQLIEEKLGWSDSSGWKQRDFLNLSDLIEDKTGVALSLSTLKRLWKANYNGTPHPSTLDALAVFLDYKNWNDFITQTNGVDTKKSTKKHNAKKVKAMLSALFAALLALIIVIFFQSHRKNALDSVLYAPQEVSFDFKYTVNNGVPNTVIFSYDVSKVQADSFFIQQSWNKHRRDKIDLNKHTLTSTYRYPGYHKAKLIANDSIIQEIGVHVKTDGWLSVGRYGYMDDSPVYIDPVTRGKNENLHLSKAQFETNQLTINKHIMASYYYVHDFNFRNNSEYTIEARIKADSILNLSCPHISLIIMGEGDMNYIPLTLKGCVGEAFLKAGNTKLSGRDTDLSALGCDIFEWQTIKVKVSESQLVIFLSNKQILDVPFTDGIGDIKGVNFNFAGTGTIDFVTLTNEFNETVDLPFN